MTWSKWCYLACAITAVLKLDIVRLCLGGVVVQDSPSSFLSQSGVLSDPLDQFEVTSAVGEFTNLGVLVVVALCVLIVLVSAFSFVLRARIDYFIFLLYTLVLAVVRENLVVRRQQYFLTFFYLFINVLLANSIGLAPYSFTPTSSFIVTLFLSSSHFTGINFIAALQHSWRMLVLFLPSIPPTGAPFLTLIELISYTARVFSLSIRLFANMMAGHALLKILSGFAWALFKGGSILCIVAVLPWLIVTGVSCLELLIAFLQAYVFIILLAIYTNDVIAMH